MGQLREGSHYCGLRNAAPVGGRGREEGEGGSAVLAVTGWLVASAWHTLSRRGAAHDPGAAESPYRQLARL